MHPSDPQYHKRYELYLAHQRKQWAADRATRREYGAYLYAEQIARRAEIKQEHGEIGGGAICVIVFLILCAVCAVGANQ